MAEQTKKGKSHSSQRHANVPSAAYPVASAELRSQSNLEQFMARQKLILAHVRQEVGNAQSENARIRNELIDKSETIRKLQKTLQTRDQELMHMSDNYYKAADANEKTMNAFNNFREKYYSLELAYDRHKEETSREIQRYQSKFEEQERHEANKMKEMSVKCNELKQMLAQKSEVYLLLDQKYCEMLKDLERLQDSLSSKDVEIFEMRKQFNESTKAAENKLLNKIKQLTDELEQRKTDLKELRHEKEEMEKQKNGIINEQLYKIREIERVFVQPARSVPPLNSRKTEKTQLHETKAQETVLPTKPPGNTSLLMENHHRNNINPNQQSSTSNTNRKRRSGTVQRRTSKRIRKNTNDNNGGNELKGDAAAATVNDNNAGIITSVNTYTSANLQTCSVNNHDTYTLLSSLSDDSSNSSSYELWAPYRAAKIDAFVPETSDTSDAFTRLKNSN